MDTATHRTSQVSVEDASDCSAIDVAILTPVGHGSLAQSDEIVETLEDEEVRHSCSRTCKVPLDATPSERAADAVELGGELDMSHHARPQP